jgi:hypothetical protein
MTAKRCGGLSSRGEEVLPGQPLGDLLLDHGVGQPPGPDVPLGLEQAGNVERLERADLAGLVFVPEVRLQPLV